MVETAWEWIEVQGHEGIWVLDGKSSYDSRACVWANVDDQLIPINYRWSVKQPTAFAEFDGEAETLEDAKNAAYEEAKRANI